MLYLAVAFIHSQTAAYIVHFIAVATPATPFACPSSPSLTHTLHTLCTHLTHRPIPERGYATLTTMATADAGDPQTVAHVEVFWISNELC